MTPARLFVFLLAASAAASATQPVIDFPTENRALIEGRPQDFYMYVDRNFEGQKSQPWQGGQYGYVRGPQRAGERVLYTSLHEGVDIRPVRRDAQGNPLDDVRAAAAGRVVHASREAGASNYGRYVVIEHREDGCPFYTLYAHLATVDVEAGQTVRQGQTIGRLGFTGAGINKERAHVHFEVCLLLSENFDAWHAAHFPGNPNRHGTFNGLNLVGADPSRLLIEAAKSPNLKLREYFAAGEPFFSLVVNDSPHFSLVRNYPWLVPSGEVANPPAWKITFTRTGVPVKIEAVRERVPEPRAVWVKETPYATVHATKGLITGSPAAPRLTDSGMRFARLLTWPD